MLVCKIFFKQGEKPVLREIPQNTETKEVQEINGMRTHG